MNFFGCDGKILPGLFLWPGPGYDDFCWGRESGFCKIKGVQLYHFLNDFNYHPLFSYTLSAFIQLVYTAFVTTMTRSNLQSYRYIAYNAK